MDSLAAVVLFVFGGVGITHVIVDGAIFAPLRDWLRARLPEYVYKVFDCYQCCGVWVGWLVGFFTFGIPYLMKGLFTADSRPSPAEFYYFAAVATFLAGPATSFLSYLGAALLSYLEANSVLPPGGDK